MKKQTRTKTIGWIIVTVAIVLFPCGQGLAMGSHASGAAKRTWPGWHKSWEEALGASKTSNKPIFILFTGSDWCGFCQLLDKNVLSTKEFAEWAKSVELCVYDMPANAKGAYYDKISDLQVELTGQGGFPGWAFCRPDGSVIGHDSGFGGEQTPQQWIKKAQKILSRKGMPN